MIDEAVKRLVALAESFPTSNGFHLGLRGNTNAVELEFGQALYGAVLDRKPEVVVELGTGPGYSATWILLGLERNHKGRLYTCDVVQPNPAIWDQVGCPKERLVPIYGLTEEIWPQLPDKIDMLFHDAGHRFEDVRRDVTALWHRIRKGGLVLMHDVVYRREMGEKVAEWFDSMMDDWKYQEVSSGCGLGIAEHLRDPL